MSQRAFNLLDQSAQSAAHAKDSGDAPGVSAVFCAPPSRPYGVMAIRFRRISSPDNLAAFIGVSMHPETMAFTRM